jgi:hypothetical protein
MSVVQGIRVGVNAAIVRDGAVAQRRSWTSSLRQRYRKAANRRCRNSPTQIK